MRIKVFTAPHLHEALAKVRQNMGPDALILDRQKVQEGNGEMVWHVHAALDQISAPESPRIPPSEVKDVHAPVASMQISEDGQTSTRNTDTALARLERIVAGLGHAESGNLRQALASGAEQEAFDHLMKIGVSGSHAFDMAADFSQKRPLGSNTIHWANRITPAKGCNALFFSGPSGCGKSTLVAKLAAHYSMKGIRVVLLSSDTERMGGLDALKAYANTLGIPFHPLKKITDIEKVLAQTQTAQLMLIDTEGWSPQRDTGLKRQGKIWDALSRELPESVSQRRFLMLPANMDEEDGMQQLKHTMISEMTDIAFSKLDETQKPGKIVNWSMASALPMSYCSFGPEVPEQMGWLNATALTTLLSKYYRETVA
ncbi:MAG: GTP-binding protein [Mariprofundus sp.]|nr:GTP-binding protein [Mariprofundus sp.]